MWRERPRIVIPRDARDGRSGDLITGRTTRTGARNTNPGGSTLACRVPMTCLALTPSECKEFVSGTCPVVLPTMTTEPATSPTRLFPGMAPKLALCQIPSPPNPQSPPSCAPRIARFWTLRSPGKPGVWALTRRPPFATASAYRPPEYHLRLNELIDDEKAAQYAPSLVGRLQRVRSQQRRSRSAQLLR